MNRSLKQSLIILFIIFFPIHGMELIIEESTKQAGDFTPLPDDAINSCITCLLNFHYPFEKYSTQADKFCFHVRNVDQLNMTCKRLNRLCNLSILDKIAEVTHEVPIDTLLFQALQSSQSRNLAQLFINKGADVNNLFACITDPTTPLVSAIRRGASLKTIALLLDKGADVHAHYEGMDTPLSEALYFFIITLGDRRSFYFEEADIIDLIQLLIKYTVDVNELNKYGKTPLCQAMPSYVGWDDSIRSMFPKESHYCNKMVRLLIEHGADVNKKNNDGKTPLYKAARIYNGVRHPYFPEEKIANPCCKETIEILIQHGAHIEPVKELGRIKDDYGKQKISKKTIHLLVKIDQQVKKLKKTCPPKLVSQGSLF